MRLSTRGFWFVGLAALVAVGAVAAAVRTPGPAFAAASITDDSGREQVQNGFSTSGNSKNSPTGLPAFTAADLDTEQADIGTNFVRFLISWNAVEPEPGTYDQHYLDGVEEMVSWYDDRGYQVMLDMHQDLWGPGITPSGDVGNGAPEWATHLDGMPVGSNDQWELYYLEPGVIRAFDNFWNTTGEHPELMDAYAGAWRAVAERFADNPAVVAYDLMNEPYGGTVQGPAFEAGPLTTLYQKSVDAIREVDNDTYACLEPQALGFNWGLPSGLGTVSDPRTGDPRIAFCPHLYPLPMDLGEGFSGTSGDLVRTTVAAWRSNTLRTAAALGDVPVILGEFGLDTTLPGALDYVTLVNDTVASSNIGVAYWSRDNGSWGPYEADGTKRNLIGVLDRAYPLAVAGAVQGWRSTATGLEIDVVPNPKATAPTAVYLPEATFPAFPTGATIDGATLDAWDPATRILTVTMTGDELRTVRIQPD